jgi:aspartate dehydrogenase
MKSRIRRVGVVGCGAIGLRIARSLTRDFSKAVRLSAIYDIDLNKARALSERLGKKNIVAKNLLGLIRRSDFIVEASSAEVSADIARQALKHRRDCLVMSVGGLLNAADIFDLAKKKNCSLYIPSGALCGIDGVKAHRLAGIKKITLITRKPAQALKGSPYVIKNRMDLDCLSAETEIFEGSAKDAVLAFPQNINVSATLSMAGIGREKTKVRIVCSPGSSVNIHEIEIESTAGKSFIRCENNPSPDNPKTSYLAIASAMATLKQIFEPVKIGT